MQIAKFLKISSGCTQLIVSFYYTGYPVRDVIKTELIIKQDCGWQCSALFQKQNMFPKIRLQILQNCFKKGPRNIDN